MSASPWMATARWNTVQVRAHTTRREGREDSESRVSDVSRMRERGMRTGAEYCEGEEYVRADGDAVPVQIPIGEALCKRRGGSVECMKRDTED